MNQRDEQFRVSGRLLLKGEPLCAWVELQDDDLVLNDFLAAGRSRADGSFHAEFPRRAFNQQSWENQSVPDLLVYVWEGLPADSPPFGPEPPTHSVRFTKDVFVDGVAALGPIELENAAYAGWTWNLRQVNTSRRPGGTWTQAEVETLSAQVRTWVTRSARRDPPARLAIRLTPMEDAAGKFRREEQEIWLDPDFLSQLSTDGVRRLLAHEWAHATAPATEKQGLELARALASVMPWATEVGELVSLSAEDLAICLVRQALIANNEGYAHYVEERVVRRHLPMSAYPLPTTWQRARLEAMEIHADHTAYRLWLAQHDENALRQLGLAWYRHHCRDRPARVRFEAKAEEDLLAACRERFDRLVRGEGRARHAGRIALWASEDF